MPFPNYQGGGYTPTGGFPNWLQSFLNLFRPAYSAPAVYTPTYGVPTYRPATSPYPGIPASRATQAQISPLSGWAPGPRTITPNPQISPMLGWAPGPRTLATTFPATQQVNRMAGWAPGPRTFGSTFPWLGPQATTAGATPQAAPVPPVPMATQSQNYPHFNEAWLLAMAPQGYQTTPQPGYTGTPPTQQAGYGYGYPGWGFGGGGRRAKRTPNYAGAPEQGGVNFQARLPQQAQGRGYQMATPMPRWMQSLVNWSV